MHTKGADIRAGFDSVRDHRGRWCNGVSGNPDGRHKGSRNRWRRSDPARAAKWTAGEWRLFFTRELGTAQGDQSERAAAAYAECQRLWRAKHPPKARPGICPQCGHVLGAPNASVNAAPLPFDNAFVHAYCQNGFALVRWHEARAALALFGINV